MKAKLTLLTLAAVILVLAGFSGCTKKDAGTTAMEKAQETNAPAEHPATDKPKDHRLISNKTRFKAGLFTRDFYFRRGALC